MTAQAHIPPSDADDGADLVLRRAAPTQRLAGLSLLLTGRVEPGAPAVDHFLLYAQEHRVALDELWLAQRDGRLVAATLVMPCAGRTALAFFSPVSAPAQVDAGARLLRAACRGQDPAKLHLVQVLLEPDQPLAARTAREAGFQALAELVYLEGRALEPFEPLRLPPPIQCQTWSQASRDLFARAILASYEETLDCPQLRGLRDIDDILEGHMASGQFLPELWYALHGAQEPVGVMLLNVAGRQRALELVYVGVAPRYRRRGLARALLRHALSLPARHGAVSVICALDQANLPAAAMYRDLGFVSTARKQALIMPLRRRDDS